MLVQHDVSTVRVRSWVKRFQAWHPEQPYLLPPDPREWLPEGHPAFLVHDLVARLDLSEIVNAYGDGRTGGMPPFDPRMMTRVWLYAYLQGVRSSRRVARALVEDVALRFLSGNQQPKYWALNAFRTRHRHALANLFRQSIELAERAGLVPLEHVAIDGTKLKANASKSRAMSYARLTAEQQRLRAEIEAYLDACDEADAAEDEAFGDDDGLGVPAHLRDRAARLEAIERAKEQLEREAKERAEREQAERREATVAQGKRFWPRVDPQAAVPRAREQRNFTDPESRIMRHQGAFVQAYNAQAAVDNQHQIIVACDLTNQAPDARHLPTLLQQVKTHTGRHPKEVSADAGYFSRANLDAIAAAGAEAFIAPERVPHDLWRSSTPPQPLPADATPKERMQHLLRTKRGKAAYLKRQTTVEPVFGQIKSARGMQQVLHRGLEKVRALWAFECAAHNLLKIMRHATATRTTQPGPAPA
jgi:transposase